MKEQLLDWHSAPLTAATKIDVAYKNTQNVRRFFKNQIGDHFNFTREFIQYLKSNVGVTLGEAAEQWKSNKKK